MLRNVEPGGKLSGRACPSCGCRGNFAGHGSYSRWLATERGEERTRARLCSLLSRGAARGELAAPIEAAGVGGIRRLHAEAHGTALAENRRFANVRRRVPLAATLPT